jgi:hypothetical protein
LFSLDIKLYLAFLKQVTTDDPLCHRNFGLLVKWIIDTQVNGLGIGFGLEGAPRMTCTSTTILVAEKRCRSDAVHS